MGKSVLNAVNRLEKGWELLTRICQVYAEFQNKVDRMEEPTQEMLMLMMVLKTASGFMAKYGQLDDA